MQKKNYGVLYIVTTQENLIYINAAVSSAQSVKQYSPALGVHIFTDANGLKHLQSLSHSPVDSTGLIENPHYRSKVDYMAESPFDRTLYLDSDTRVVADITELFELLERFDCAIGHAHNRNFHKTSQIWTVGIPPAFPQYNSGVFLYKNSEKMNDLLKRWSKSFHESGFKKDQVTLRELLWLSDLRLATLPPEYNIRHAKYIRIWTKKEATPKILHMEKFHQKNLLIFMLRKIRRFLRDR